MLSDLSVEAYLENVASGEPTPGGGSICALVATAAAALTAMVAGLTIGRPKYAAVQASIQEVQQQAAALRKRLLMGVDEDARAYDQVMEAFRLPKVTPEERVQRDRIIQAAFKRAAEIPLEVAEHALAVMALSDQAISMGNPNAATDGFVAALMARSAVIGAVCNVHINLEWITDQDYVERVGCQAQQLEILARKKEEEILDRRNR